MFDLSYEELSNSAFAQALNKLSTATGFESTKAAYDAGRLTGEVFATMAKCQEEFIPLASTYILKDDKGQPVRNEHDQNSVKLIPEKMDEWNKVYSEFKVKKATIKRHKLDLKTLPATALSPQDLVALEPVLILS